MRNNAVVHIQQDEYERGKKYIDGISCIKRFSHKAEIADGIKSVKTGGHSVGSCIVEITSDAEKYPSVSFGFATSEQVSLVPMFHFVLFVEPRLHITLFFICSYNQIFRFLLNFIYSLGVSPFFSLKILEK